MQSNGLTKARFPYVYHMGIQDVPHANHHQLATITVELQPIVDIDLHEVYGEEN